MLDLVLYIVAAICFLLAAIGVASKVNLVAIGPLAWVLVPLLHAASAVG